MGNAPNKLIALIASCSDSEEQAQSADPRIYYEASEQVGEGAFGRVVKVTPKKQLRESTELCAKIVDVEQAIKTAAFSERNGLSREEVFTLLVNEIQVLKKAKPCEFVVTYAESFKWQNEYWIICELCTVGNLVDILKRIRLNEDDHRTIVFSVLKAIEFLHDRGFVHSDVKLENLLVDGSGVIKLCDFGGACKCDQNGFTSTRFAGTLPYPPVEVLARYMSSNFSDYVPSVFHQKRDIWAIGVLALKLEDGESRLDLVAEYYGVRGLFTAISYGYDSHPVMLDPEENFLTFFRPQDVPDERIRFVDAALVVDLRQRPSASELLAQSFISHNLTQQNYKSHVLGIVQRYTVAPEPKKVPRTSDFFEPILLKKDDT